MYIFLYISKIFNFEGLKVWAPKVLRNDIKDIFEAIELIDMPNNWVLFAIILNIITKKTPNNIACKNHSLVIILIFIFTLITEIKNAIEIGSLPVYDHRMAHHIQ